MKGQTTTLVGAALAICAAAAHGQSAVYEGWDYPAGTQPGISPGGGVGWAPGSGYSQALGVASSGLSHPNALPSIGNALQSNADVPSIDISRPLNAALDSTQTTWMSFLGRRDAADAAYTVSLQQLSGNRTFSASFGIDVDSSSGDLKYKARWENVGFAVMGGDSFAGRPLSNVAATDLFLVRVNAADAGAGTQTFDLWVDPDPGNLGAPDASVVWPSAVRSWSQVHYSGSDATFDEFRIDSSLANVVNIPTPGAGLLVLPAAVWVIGRRRRS